MTVHFNGVDFAYGNGVTAGQLKAAGVQFVCRYLSDDTDKDISAEELANYRAAGIAVVLNWESTGEMPDEAQGVADAQRAQSEAAALGEASAPVIFSADFNPGGDTTPMVAYMRGVKSVLGLARTGIYGCFTSVGACFDAGLVTYGWQTSAWSDDQWDDRAQLQQYNYGIYIGPAQVDQDRAMAQDFGQIGSVAPAPPPPPRPVPAPAPGGWPTVAAGDSGVLVEALQLLLNAHGAGLAVDGDFGPGTEAAVAAFQNGDHLSVDGIVNGQTWPAIVITVQQGQIGNAVKAAQTMMGHVPVDGDFGPQTRARVVAVQAAHKIQQDGIVGPATWKVLAVAQA
jgi:peptidoglycan hydrolase-like protein with peptidoglycan-binding domain